MKKLIFLGLLFATPLFAGEGPYQVQEGDTPESVAEKFFNDAAVAREIMLFNRLDPNASLETGSYLIIPIEDRKLARAAVVNARKAVEAAAEFQPEIYAESANKHMLETLRQVEKALQEADFARVSSLGDICIRVAQNAADLAKINARVDENGEIVSFSGDVQVSRGSATNAWMEAAVGMPLQPGQWVLTASGSQVNIRLRDGSLLTVEPNALMQYEEFKRDRRTTQVNARVKVLMGELLGDIVPRKHRKSTFEVKGSKKGGNSSLAIRGTKFSFLVDPRRARSNLAVWKGQVTAIMGDLPKYDEMVEHGFLPIDQMKPERKRQVNQGEGLVMDNRGFSNVVRLPPPPQFKGRLAGNAAARIFPSNLATIRWQGEDPRAVADIQIARDENFQDLVLRETSPLSPFRSGQLQPGPYFIRMTGVLSNGMRGKPGDTIRFEVQPDFSYGLRLQGSAVKQGDTYVLGSDARVIALREIPDNAIREFISREGSQGKFHEVTGPIPVQSVKPVVLEVIAVGHDNELHGNKGLRVRLDNRPPRVAATIVRNPRKKGYIVSFEARDDTAVQVIRWSNDGREFRDYKGPIHFDNLVNLRIYFLAIDVVGNSSALDSVQLQGINAIP